LEKIERRPEDRMFQGSRQEGMCEDIQGCNSQNDQRRYSTRFCLRRPGWSNL
jgi:hypothetical protein